jgi:hypothetical protein
MPAFLLKLYSPNFGFQCYQNPAFQTWKRRIQFQFPCFTKFFFSTKCNFPFSSQYHVFFCWILIVGFHKFPTISKKLNFQGQFYDDDSHFENNNQNEVSKLLNSPTASIRSKKARIRKRWFTFYSTVLTQDKWPQQFHITN